MEGRELQFFVSHNDKGKELSLSEYDTIKQLKHEIYREFNIEPHEQAIEGWEDTPEDDNTILQMCAKMDDITCLSLAHQSSANYSNEEQDKQLELDASIKFIETILNECSRCSIIFHTCRLQDAIQAACLTTLEKRKILLLCFFNKKDAFSKTLRNNLKLPEVNEIMQRSFFLLGWDIEDEQYHSALLNVLNQNDLSYLSNLITSKVSAALCIVPIKDSTTVFACLEGNVSNKSFLTALSSAENFLLSENREEENLEQLENDLGNGDNDMGSVNYQKLMAEMLGDRDYDSFEFDEHEQLKQKIAYALLGPPQEEKGYDEKPWKKMVLPIYEAIVKISGTIAKYKDKVEISFVYNCTEPLPNEKNSRAKKYKDYNPNTDLKPVPIFVLRKCRDSNNCCRIFIDDIGRSYLTWQEYLKRNKLPKCVMILPKNGRYKLNENNEVLLERHLSPSCGIDSKILQGTDYISTAGGLVSGGIFIAAAIPAVAVAPAALIAGGVIGVGAGIYSLSRSAYTLYDRVRHKETLSFANSEARGAYLNIVAGALGFVGAGANVAVTQLAARGMNIGQGAAAAVNTLGFVNIGASGASVVNSSYDIIDQWINENQAPSLLTMVQLSSSILFFGHAVYNFQTCATIVENAQTKTLLDYQESLRSNRHRKTFAKLMKETIRQNDGNITKGSAEVISAIRQINNKDEVFAVLTRSNKEMNRKGIKFAAEGGTIKLNGITVDLAEFATLSKKDAGNFLGSLPLKKDITLAETKSMQTIITSSNSNMLANLPPLTAESLAGYMVKLLSLFSGDVQTKVINALAGLLAQLAQPILQQLDLWFPNHSKVFHLFDMVVDFFKMRAKALEQQYKNWKATGEEQYYNPIFKTIGGDKIAKIVGFFETAVRLYFMRSTEAVIAEILKYFTSWFAVQLCNYENKKESEKKRRLHSARHPVEKESCAICGGYFYIPNVVKKRKT